MYANDGKRSTLVYDILTLFDRSRPTFPFGEYECTDGDVGEHDDDVDYQYDDGHDGWVIVGLDGHYHHNDEDHHHRQ